RIIPVPMPSTYCQPPKRRFALRLNSSSVVCFSIRKFNDAAQWRAAGGSRLQIGTDSARPRKRPLGCSFMNFVWLSSNLSPILPAHILVNLNGRVPTIKRITTVSLWAGNPIWLTCLCVFVVVLKASDTLKALALVVDGAARLG